MKRNVVLFAALCALALSGCAKKGGEISVFIWTEYLPESATNRFQKEFGAKVNVATYSSAADMYAKVKSSPAGTYDVLCATEFYITRLADEGLIEKLDYAKIPNRKNLSPVFLDKYYDRGNVYSVPYLCSVAPIVINRDLVSVPVSGYADLYNEAFKNGIVILDDVQIVIGSVNRMLGFDYSETDLEKLKVTEARLLALKPNIKMLDSDSPKTALISGECAAGVMWNGEIAIAMEEMSNLEIVYPPEGFNIMLDSLCLAAGSKNREKALEFINFILDPEVSAMISADYPYTNPNTEAVKLLGADYQNNPAKNPTPEELARGIESRDLDNETLERYNLIWTRFTTQ